MVKVLGEALETGRDWAPGVGLEHLGITLVLGEYQYRQLN
jgi:hypothetical protein